MGLQFVQGRLDFPTLMIEGSQLRSMSLCFHASRMVVTSWDRLARSRQRRPGSRITDFISLGVIAKTFPVSKIYAILAATGKSSVRQRDLPAHVVVYYVIALALYMHSSYREVLRCLLEGIQWLLDPSATVKVAGKSGISQARTRLGWEAVRRLHDEVVRPIAIRSDPGSLGCGMALGQPGW